MSSVRKNVLLRHITTQSYSIRSREYSLEKSDQLLEKSIHRFRDSDYLSSHQQKTCKKSRNKIFICRFHQMISFFELFDSIQKGKMEQILLLNGLPKETLTPKKIFYKTTETIVHSLNGNTDFFEIILRVLQGYILAPCLSIICHDYVLRT